MIASLCVVVFLIHEITKQAQQENEEIFENYENIPESLFWGESSDVWGFKTQTDLSRCPDYFTLQSLESSFALPCIPQSVPKYRRYEDISILGIDATFADDTEDFVDIHRFFAEEGANFYSTQSPGRFPGSGVIRSTANFIFGDKKTLYVFYNQANPMPKYMRQDIVEHINSYFPELDDVKLHSFFYYKKVLSDETFSSNLGRLLYYIGDCELPEHEYCKNELRPDGKYTAFTQQMITNDLDFFFILPAHGQPSNTTFEVTSGPKRFLQGLFKAPSN